MWRGPREWLVPRPVPREQSQEQMSRERKPGKKQVREQRSQQMGEPRAGQCLRRAAAGPGHHGDARPIDSRDVHQPRYAQIAQAPPAVTPDEVRPNLDAQQRVHAGVKPNSVEGVLCQGVGEVHHGGLAPKQRDQSPSALLRVARLQQDGGQPQEYDDAHREHPRGVQGYFGYA